MTDTPPVTIDSLDVGLLRRVALRGGDPGEARDGIDGSRQPQLEAGAHPRRALHLEPPAQEPGQPTTPVPEPPATAPYGAQPGYGQPGYGQPGYGQPGYGAPAGYGYGYPTGPPTDGTATAALVIAVVGFFVCAPVGAVVALVMANSAQRRIEASGGRLGGLELAKAARIIAIVELALTALLILGGVIAVAASLGART